MTNPYFGSHSLDSMGGPVGASFQSRSPFSRLHNILRGGGGGSMAFPNVQASPMSPLAAQALAAENAAAGADLATAVEWARGDDAMYGVDSGSANIAAAASATISVQPQKRHIPQRLVVSEAMANNFLLTAISVGVEPVLITTGAMSMAIFIQNCTCPPFRAVICEVGNTVNVSVTNIGGATLRFTGSITGKYLPAF